MATTTGQSLITTAGNLLADVGAVRWTNAELLSYLNEGQTAIAILQPTATNTVTSMKMVSGTRQTIPATGWLLLDITRNMGTDGLTPGGAIRIASREVMDAYNPNWHSITPTTAIQNFMYSLNDQTAFYVYPPSDGTGYIEVNYSATPAALTSSSQTINVTDMLAPALINYIMYRACSKDAEFPAGAALASTYQNAFISLVKGKEMSEKEESINWGLVTKSPETRGGSS